MINSKLNSKISSQKSKSALSIIYLIIFTISISLLSSCAQYEAQYTPPPNQDGMECIKSCLSNKQACSNNCNNRKMIADVANAVGKSLTYKDKKAEQNKINNYRSSDNTGMDYDCACQTEYVDCYRSCGGNVNYVCVAHCK